MKWLKYRRKSSSGYGDWLYKPYYNEKDLTENRINDFIQELSEEYSWSEHHRGYVYVVIETENVPAKVLYDELRRLELIIDTAVLEAQEKTAKANKMKEILKPEIEKFLEKEIRNERIPSS
jgi:hypothetical protein